MAFEEDLAKLAGQDQSAAAIKVMADTIIEFRQHLVDGGIPKAEVQRYVLAYLEGIFQTARDQQSKGG